MTKTEKEEERLDQFSFDKSMAGAREEIETAEREAVRFKAPVTINTKRKKHTEKKAKDSERTGPL